jgi:hypothetical protein
MDGALAVRSVLQRQPEILGAPFQRVEQVRGNVMGVDVDGHFGARSVVMSFEQIEQHFSAADLKSYTACLELV